MYAPIPPRSLRETHEYAISTNPLSKEALIENTRYLLESTGALLLLQELFPLSLEVNKIRASKLCFDHSASLNSLKLLANF